MMSDSEILRCEMAGPSLAKLRENHIEEMSKIAIDYIFSREKSRPLEYNPFESYTPFWEIKPPLPLDDTIEHTFTLGEPGVNRNKRDYDYDYLLNKLYLRHLFGVGRGGGRKILFNGEEIIFFKYLLHITHNADRSVLRKICNINIDRCYDIVYTHIDKLKSIEKRNLIRLTGYKVNMEDY